MLHAFATNRILFDRHSYGKYCRSTPQIITASKNCTLC